MIVVFVLLTLPISNADWLRRPLNGSSVLIKDSHGLLSMIDVFVQLTFHNI